jgi:hypothetical protein
LEAGVVASANFRAFERRSPVSTIPIRLSRSLRHLLPLILLAVVIVNVGLTQPAHADPCSPWSSEDAMRNAPPSCRGTWVVEPGQGNFIGREQLLRADLYNHHGFSRQFRWYAYSTTQLITNPDQVWAYCQGGLNTDEFCPSHQVTDTNNGLLSSFGPSQITLHTYSFKGKHIAQVCGNFFRTGVSQEDPVPHMTVFKFDDRNRNGTQDAGEQGLEGWQFRIVRVTSRFADQDPGQVGTVVTNSSGTADFRFDGDGPGLYRIEEVPRDGWAPTTPAVQNVVVDPGIGDAHLGTFRFGNAETTAELVKVNFNLVDPPQRMEADQPTNLLVRAEIHNDGPADVTVKDTVDVTLLQPDCTATPSYAEIIRTLARGESATVDFAVSVICTEPSYHTMRFVDHLYVVTPGVEDPNPSNNTVSFEHVFPVFDRADITLSDTTVTCPARSDVGVAFTCTATTSVGNAGPYGPADAVVTFGLTGPKDCSETSVGGSDHQMVTVPVGDPATVTVTWSVTCDQRSYHDFEVLANASIDHLHVEDLVEGNSDERAPVTVEIFEPADLSVTNLDIRCTEREATTLSSSCTASVVVTNAGPATDVAALSTLVITPEPACTAAPTASVDEQMTLAALESRAMTVTWTLTCSSADRHAVRVTATVRTDEPHAEDRNLPNNTISAVWGPLDVKPRSLPSSINIGKEGRVPFAVLSTATLNAMTDIQRTGLTFGSTGTEPSVVSCASQGEDVNGDGRLDLICHATTQLLNLTCDTTTLRLIGQTTEGVRFYAEDTVKVVGCH